MGSEISFLFQLKGFLLLFISFIPLAFAFRIWTKRPVPKISLHLGVMAFFSFLCVLTCGLTLFFFRQASFWARFKWLGILALPPYNVFVYYFSRKEKNLRIKAVVLYLIAGLFVVLSFTTDLITDFSSIMVDRSAVDIGFKIGPWGIWGRLYILFCLLLGGYNLFKEFFQSKGVRRLQIKYLLLGLFVYTFSVFIDLIILPVFRGIVAFTTIPAFFSVCWVGLTCYAVFKYQLIDIHIFFSRVILVSAAYSIVFIFPFYIGYRTNLWPLSTAMAVILTLPATLIYRYFVVKAENLLLKKNRQYQKILLASSEDILNINEKDELLGELCSLLFRSVSPRYVAVYSLEGRQYNLKKVIPQGVSVPFSLDFGERLVQNLSRVDSTYTLGDTYIGLPIGREERMKGVLLLGERVDEHIYTQEDIEVFNTLLNQVSLAIENIEHIAEVMEQQEERERLSEEMDMIRRIQKSLLPEEGIYTDDFQVDGLLISALEVASDYYDFITYSPEKVGVVIADVSGKGVEAGMVMSMAKSSLHAFASLGLSPKELVINLNKNLYEQLHQQRFISLIYGEYSSIDNTFTWINAGHEPIIVYREKGEFPEIEVIETEGISLGMVGNIKDKVSLQRVSLNRGDRIIFYTDGVIEARNVDGAPFGFKKLVELLKNVRTYSAVDLMFYLRKQLLQHIHGASLYDDITLVVLGR